MHRNTPYESALRSIGSRRPPSSMVVAVVALLVALSGSATAALFITGKQIKNGTVTGKDLKNRTLGTNKLSKKALSALNGQAGPAGAQGPKGDPGSAGPQGERGAPGPGGAADVYASPPPALPFDLPATPAPVVTSSNVPPGDYLVTFMGGVAQTPANGAAETVKCSLFVNGEIESPFPYEFRIGANAGGPVTPSTAITTTAATSTLQLRCRDDHDNGGALIQGGRLMAVHITSE